MTDVKNLSDMQLIMLSLVKISKYIEVSSIPSFQHTPTITVYLNDKEHDLFSELERRANN